MVTATKSAAELEVRRLAKELGGTCRLYFGNWIYTSFPIPGSRTRKHEISASSDEHSGDFGEETWKLALHRLRQFEAGRAQ